MNASSLKDKWDIVKAKLVEKYALLTGSELVYVEGNEDELLSRVQKIAGVSREELNKFLQEELSGRLESKP
ncbi:MAG TPA: hypothetical protein VKC60_01590 [Opitutaceae bacterium]|nr:hypothetical protein [Opitutaceae bacterium]